MLDANANGDTLYVILYARVSREEQVKGYSLPQQIEALRDYASRKGYVVHKEIVDAGYSAATLVRPGMDETRDTVEAGGMAAVLAQDADRITREPHHRALLDEEFAGYGCALVALDDWGDESHEGQLLKFMKGWVSKGERLKTAERTRRGLMRKAREGKIIKSRKANFGFRFNEAGDALVVHAEEMRLVNRLFRMAAEEDMGPKSIQTRLYAEGIPSPTGRPWWPHRIIKTQILLNDLYRPHTFKEVAPLVSAEVAAKLNHEGLYGIWWFNRRSVQTRLDSVAAPGGERRYKKRTTTTTKDRSDWIAVPVVLDGDVPPLTIVDRARELTLTRRGNERRHESREWELKNLVRCRCGQNMILHISRGGSQRKTYYYYRCKRATQYGSDSCGQKCVRIEKVEPPVWGLVYSLLTDPDRLRRGLKRMRDDDKKDVAHADPSREIAEIEARLMDIARGRNAYQDQQAAGLMTLDELRERLEASAAVRRQAEERLASLRRLIEPVEDIEDDEETILAALAGQIPAALEELTGDDRNALYRMLRLEVVPDAERLMVSGVLVAPETHACG